MKNGKEFSVSEGCTYTCKRFSAIGRDPAAAEDSLRKIFSPFQVSFASNELCSGPKDKMVIAAGGQ